MNIINKYHKKIERKLLRLYKKINKAYTYLLGIFEYNFLSRFTELAPKKMIINLTYWCNSRCVMCNIWKIRPKGELTYEEWEKILKDPIFRNIEDLTISGGEPMMHKDFHKIATLFVENMPKLKILTVITNGFETKSIIMKFRKLAVYLAPRKIHLSASVSLDGVGKMHEDIRKIPDGFKKTVLTLFMLKKMSRKYNLSVGSGSLLMNENVAQRNKMRRWYAKYKIPYSFQLIGFHDTFVNNMETKEELDFKKKRKTELLNFLSEESKPKSLTDFRSLYWKDMYNYYKNGGNRVTPCPFLKDQFVLDSWGDVYYCLSTKPIGNCRKESSVSEIYYSEKNKKRRVWMKDNVCIKCNSGCNVDDAIAKDFKKYFWYRLTGKLLK